MAKIKVCKCECGGQVWGIRQFGRLFTWCSKCTPVQTIKRDPAWLRFFKRRSQVL